MDAERRIIMMLVSRERQGKRGQEGKKDGRKKVKASPTRISTTGPSSPGTVVGKAKAHHSRPTRSGDYLLYVLIGYLSIYASHA